MIDFSYDPQRFFALAADYHSRTLDYAGQMLRPPSRRAGTLQRTPAVTVRLGNRLVDLGYWLARSRRSQRPKVYPTLYAALPAPVEIRTRF